MDTTQLMQRSDKGANSLLAETNSISSKHRCDVKIVSTGVSEVCSWNKHDCKTNEEVLLYNTLVAGVTPKSEHTS